MSGPHDLLFREVFSSEAPARWLLARALPDLSLDGPWSLLDTTAIAGGAEREPDLIWQIGESLRVRTVWQHQARPDPRMDLRVLRDTATLLHAWADEDPLPIPVTLVISQHPRGWTVPTDVHDRLTPPPHLDPLVVRCPYRVLDLHDLSEADLTTAPPAAHLALALLRAWRTLPVGQTLWDVLTDHAPTVQTLLRTAGRSAITAFLRYLIIMSPDVPREVPMAQLTTIDPDLPDDFVSMADALHARGREEGVERGRATAARDLLLRLATARFGPPTRAQRERLQTLSADDLTDRAVAVLTATGWDDLVG